MGVQNMKVSICDRRVCEEQGKTSRRDQDNPR